MPLIEDGISLEFLHNYGNVKIYDFSSGREILSRSKDADIIIINKIIIDRELINSLPKLKYIAITATGYNNIDIEYAKQKGIRVSNIPSYSSDAVAQHTFALILELYNKVKLHSDMVKENIWANNKIFSFWSHPIYNLKGKKLGLLGYGEIAKIVAKIGLAFGMDILVSRKNNIPEDNIKYVDIDTLFKESDILSVHAPLTQDTKDIVNIKKLEIMKPSAIIINTARGGFINENDLAKALEEKIIAGAGLDVMRQEPPEENHPLYNLDNCIITPHIAWASVESRQKLVNILEQNIKSFIEDRADNIVN